MSDRTPEPPDLTRWLQEWSDGSAAALERLTPVVYGELRRIAARHLRGERRGRSTLEPTELVHEAFLRLVRQKVSWQNRAHFFGVAAAIMRRLLVDHARKRRAGKRGAGAAVITLDPSLHFAATSDVDLIALDDCLAALARIDPDQSRVVELRFFGGLSVEESANVLGVSPTTVKREWRMARAWLLREMMPAAASA